VGSNYWTTFFPATIVLGLGMAVSVAPLTTTVMNSVTEHRAGVASGINNAVSRTAGLLAIAVLGLIMFKTFDSCLDQRLNQLSLTPEIRHTLDSQRIRLAAIDIPTDLDQATRFSIKQSINECFVEGFRRVSLVGAALAFVSSLVAWLLIRRKNAT
jgi:MFS family permease